MVLSAEGAAGGDGGGKVGKSGENGGFKVDDYWILRAYPESEVKQCAEMHSFLAR